MGGIAELRLRFFWCISRWCSGEEGKSSSSSACSGGVDGGSDSCSQACLAGVAANDGLPPEDAAEDVVASRMYSMTSQVWRVASGAKDTRRFAAVFCQTHSIS